MALITYLTRIQFDFGALQLLDAELQLLGMRRPLVITDKGVIAAGIWDKVKAQLPGNMPVTVYDGTPENPTEAAMRDALALYKAQGCDGIIAIGSGAPYATAAARALLRNTNFNAYDIALESMRVAASLCIFTNDQIEILSLPEPAEEQPAS